MCNMAGRCQPRSRLCPDEHATAAVEAGRRTMSGCWRSRWGYGGPMDAIQALLRKGAPAGLSAIQLLDTACGLGFPVRQVNRLLAICELTRRWHVTTDSAAPPVTSPRQAVVQFQGLRASTRQQFAVL